METLVAPPTPQIAPPPSTSLGEWSPPDSHVRRCTRCLYDEHTPGAKLDQGDVCAYCLIHDDLCAEYPLGDAGQAYLDQLAARIKRDGRGGKYDVVVGVSGGCDSSYLLYKTVQMGLRPLAVHFDNTWNSATAVENIRNVLGALDVDLYTHVVDNEEYDDILRAFLRAGVPDIETPTDIGLAATLYQAAEKHGIKHIFNGHSFRTEGITPLGWIYMDGKYIQSVVRQFGEGRKLKTFPNLWMHSQLRWQAVRGIERHRPLWYMAYPKEEVKQFLIDEFGWKWYGGHHLENRLTAFYHSYFMPRRYGIDQRVTGYAAHVRSGQMTHAEGLAELSQPPHLEPEMVELVRKRLGFSADEFESLMDAPKRSWRDFKTYKRTFERMRPFYYLLYKTNRIPKSFYLKYTAKDEG